MAGVSSSVRQWELVIGLPKFNFNLISMESLMQTQIVNLIKIVLVLVK